MNVFEELQARGMIAQMTNEEKIKDLLVNDKIKFYIGAKSNSLENAKKLCKNISDALLALAD